jgi:hypothetical protein
MPAIVTGKNLHRRHFLRGAGVALALPLLDAMTPALARGEINPVPHRFFGICNNLGLLPDLFFPAADSAGAGYKPSPYLEHLAAFRSDFTVLSGVSHPDVDAGHPADNCFLTAAPHPSSGGFHNTISLDQYAAERLGNRTRFPSLTLGVNVQQGQRSLSWTRGGVLIPSEEKAAAVFKRMFITGSPEEIQAQTRRLALGQSIMDTVADQTRSLERKVGAADRARLDQYLTGVRDLEGRLASASEWEQKPKPVVKEQAPVDPTDPREYMEKVRLMYDMARLAFENDSTRFVALLLDSVNSPAITVDNQPTDDGYHNLSHHGKNPAKLSQLERIDRGHMKLLAQLFGDLKARPEGGETLLDRTMILYGSNMGNANTHNTTNLPVLFAGGGFRHGQHLAFDRDWNYPLPNLFVSVLHRLGIEEDRFASGTSTMRGLDLKG